MPYDGDTIYYGKILDHQKSDYFFEQLLHHIKWKNDEVVVFGKHIITKRQVAWYGDDNFEYTYSSISRRALIWTKELIQLKKVVEEISGHTFNSCLLNLYHDGNEGMGWHSDNEKELGTKPVIASVSLGAKRKFVLKHKETKEKVSIFLENGSLLVMQGATQYHWQHSLTKSKKVTKPRINLTFRTIRN